MALRHLATLSAFLSFHSPHTFTCSAKAAFYVSSKDKKIKLAYGAVPCRHLYATSPSQYMMLPDNAGKTTSVRTTEFIPWKPPPQLTVPEFPNFTHESPSPAKLPFPFPSPSNASARPYPPRTNSPTRHPRHLRRLSAALMPLPGPWRGKMNSFGMTPTQNVDVRPSTTGRAPCPPRHDHQAKD